MTLPPTPGVAFRAGGVPPYPADLYRFAGVVEDGVDGLASVDDAAVRRFHRDGYLVIRDALGAQEVAEALDEMLDLLALPKAEFGGIHFEHLAPNEKLAEMAPEVRQDYVRKFFNFVQFAPRIKGLSEHPALLDAVARVIGARPALFQDMALLKPPRIGREKPWHQDHAYFDLPLDTPVVGVWIALDRATTDNGCMTVIPGSHRRGPVVHFQRRDWQICDTHVDTRGALAVPLEPGGCLLFSSFTHHGTPTNTGSERRRALQFHYAPAGAGRISTEQRMAVFGSEGKSVTC
ncbi:MAG: phytanoyl-CoA dioxygenase family protein [Spirochaetaceae bacterium]|nr:phytanoyl-CoA dioxygenase family protein [Spirochaetaceae bacterium]